MIWQRSVVAKEKVRTIEVNDYGCKNSFKSSYNSLQISVLKEVPSGNFNSTNSSGNVNANVSPTLGGFSTVMQ